jgi:3-deoxy-D-manno-octulosonate 8-phosphate phosphatase (KDO 8-P phosphatase)
MNTDEQAGSIATRARRIKLVLLDVDGVLTDGTLTLHADGSESKDFNIKDGAAIVWTMHAGLTVGFLSARESAATAERARQLGVTLVTQGVESKATAYAAIVAAMNLSDEQVAYMGDDLVDLAVLRRAGLAAAPADAVAEVAETVHWLSRHPGGGGAVRELLEMILMAQGRWDGVVRRFSV